MPEWNMVLALETMLAILVGAAGTTVGFIVKRGADIREMKLRVVAIEVELEQINSRLESDSDRMLSIAREVSSILGFLQAKNGIS